MRQWPKPFPRGNAKRQSWGVFTNSWEKKRSERQGRKGKDVPNWMQSSGFRVLKIVMRNKKAFLSEQCKEIEENNRMGKTSNLLKKIGDTKGTFHTHMREEQ